MALLAMLIAASAPAEAQWFRRFVNAFRPLAAAPSNPADKPEETAEADDGTIYLVRPDLTVVRTLRAMQQKLTSGV